jgi:hypothetical protein
MICKSAGDADAGRVTVVVLRLCRIESVEEEVTKYRENSLEKGAQITIRLPRNGQNTKKK